MNGFSWFSLNKLGTALGLTTKMPKMCTRSYRNQRLIHRNVMQKSRQTPTLESDECNVFPYTYPSVMETVGENKNSTKFSDQ